MKRIKTFSYQLNYALKVHQVFLMVLVSSVFWSQKSQAQPETGSKVYQGVILDEVMVKAVQGGFDVKSFIDKIRKDTTFYKAFKTLRLMSYTMYNDIEIVDKKGATKASLNSITKQTVKDRCRSMQVIQEKVAGDFYTRKHDYNYYTAKLYAHLFFTKGTVCNESNVIGPKVNYKGTAKYEEQLRMLIFNPGQRIYGIPGIGENVAIFEKPTMDKYEFRLYRENYLGDDCYVFKAKPKANSADDVVVNELKSWIRVSDNAMLARDYSLSYNTWIYDFDVVMRVKLKTVKGQLIPYEISYKGNWHAVTQPREIGTFTAIFTDFS
jgi:hypothetical protein